MKVLTNSLASTDVPVVHAGYARYRSRLLACGVQLYERRPGDGSARSDRARLSSGASLHAKAVVVDRKWVLLGSMKLVWTGDEQGKPARFTSEPLAGGWRRFVSALLGALAPEEML